MTTRDEILTKALEDQYMVDCIHPPDSLIACNCCIARRDVIRAALEAAAKLEAEAIQPFKLRNSADCIHRWEHHVWEAGKEYCPMCGTVIERRK